MSCRGYVYSVTKLIRKLLCLFMFIFVITFIPVRYVTKTWSIVLLNKKILICYLKCIVYDKLLNP